MSALTSSNSYIVNKLTKKKQKKSPREIVKDFCESTSAHGFQYLNFEKDKRHSCLWLCLIFMAFAAFVGTFSLLIIRFLSYPTSVEILESAIPFIFPDVTICPVRNMHLQKIDLSDYNKTYFFPRSKNATYSSVFFSMAKFWTSVLRPDETKEDMNWKLARQSLNPYLPDIEIFQDPQDIIIACTFRGEKCSYLNFTETWHPERFRCFTFKPQNRTIFSASKDGGLILVLYFEKHLFISSELEMANMNDGVRVIIHPENTMPDFSIDEYSVSAGTLFEQKLFMYRAASKNRPTSQCLIDPDLTTYYFNSSTNKAYKHPVYNYTAEDCRNSLLQQNFVNHCGCLSPDHYVPYKLRDYPLCYEVPQKYWENGLQKWGHPDDPYYIADTFDNVTVVEPDIVKKLRCEQRFKVLRLKQDSKAKMCSQSCTYTWYKTTVERLTWPASTTLSRYYFNSRILETAQDAKDHGQDYFFNTSYFDKNIAIETKEHFMKINIFAGNSDGILQKEEFVYPINNLLSDMMGMLGFWTGISVLSICEVIQFLIKLIRRLLEVSTEKQFHKNRTNSIANNDNKTFDQNECYFKNTSTPV